MTLLQVFNPATNVLIGTLPSTGKGNFSVTVKPVALRKSSLGGSATTTVVTRR
jgi:hypothetical protein